MTFRGGMGRNGRRLHVGSTEDWEQIELLCGWPEQRDYELIRSLVLFGGPASERAEAAGAVVYLKAEYPGFNPNEIVNACYVRSWLGLLRRGSDETLRPGRDPGRGRVAEGSQAGGLRTQKLTPAGDASASSLHLHGRHLAATQRRILLHPCDSHTSQGFMSRSALGAS